MSNNFGVRISHCNTGISVSHGGLEGLRLDASVENCGIGVLERDPPNLAEKIGLPRQTPPEHLIEVLNILKAHKKVDAEQKIAHIKRSRIWDAIQGAANATGVIASLIAISSDPGVAQMIETLKLTLRK